MALDEGKPGGPPPADQPRIHVDSDWKKQAQAEKERLAREVERQAAPLPPPSPGVGAGPGPTIPAERPMGEIPPASFPTLVETLATQAAIFLSDRVDPETGQSLQHLELAKHTIDLLSMLEEKTKGNLTDEEKRVLDSMLYELRMAYISAAS
ncbi:MAG: DUF1844 domain-containing protein [Planctomycetota bacterium]|nr:DUF1844 domain-containing protein [Planctomycetota bacterium]